MIYQFPYIKKWSIIPKILLFQFSIVYNKANVDISSIFRSNGRYKSKSPDERQKCFSNPGITDFLSLKPE